MKDKLTVEPVIQTVMTSTMRPMSSKMTTTTGKDTTIITGMTTITSTTQPTETTTVRNYSKEIRQEFILWQQNKWIPDEDQDLETEQSSWEDLLQSQLSGAGNVQCARCLRIYKVNIMTVVRDMKNGHILWIKGPDVMRIHDMRCEVLYCSREIKCKTRQAKNN